MDRKKQLQLVIDIYKKRIKAAEKRLQSLFQNKNAEQQRLNLLTQYQQEYLARLDAPNQVITNLSLQNNLKQFVGQLTDNIEKQQGQVDMASNAIEKQKEHMAFLNGKLESIQLLQNEIRKKQEKELLIEEQKILDELVRLKLITEE